MLKLKITDENGEVIYEGFAEHLSNLVSAIVGYDEVSKAWMPIGVTDRGLSKTANYIWNTNTLAWESSTTGAGGLAQDVNVNNFPSGIAINNLPSDYAKEEGNLDSINKNLIPYNTLIDDFSSIDKTYIGKALSGSSESNSVWQIKCIDETGDYMKIKFADGVSTFTKKWSDRITYSYL
jgi:hypothetical protein